MSEYRTADAYHWYHIRLDHCHRLFMGHHELSGKVRQPKMDSSFAERFTVSKKIQRIYEGYHPKSCLCPIVFNNCNADAFVGGTDPCGIFYYRSHRVCSYVSRDCSRGLWCLFQKQEKGHLALCPSHSGYIFVRINHRTYNSGHYFTSVKRMREQFLIYD